MTDRLSDKDRANMLNLSLEDFQKLVGHDPLERHSEFTSDAAYVSPKDDKKKPKKKKKKASDYYGDDDHDPLYHGDHIHTKENPLGLHRHYPGGPLGGGHLHDAQNPGGSHTHRYTREEMIAFSKSRPGAMIDIDGKHEHRYNKPDGGHEHSPENFKPASDN
tara:strand:- start:111 stop:596 length:486 start_codon:yes stop_codon:yes gene_type:complete